MKKLYFFFVACLMGFLAACNNQQNNSEANLIENDTTPVVTHFDYTFYSDTILEPIITADLNDGNVILTFNHDAIVSYGYVSDDEYRLPDWPVEVENLRGTPKSVFIGDIGQDYNPILCVLLDDGRVNLLDLWNVVRYGDLSAGTLNLNDIVSLHSGGGDPYEEDGEVMYLYTTIYATDKEGTEHEVNLYLLHNDIQSCINNNLLKLNLTTDWKITYVVEDEYGAIRQQYWGDFHEISSNYETNVTIYSYQMNRQMDFTEGQEPIEKNIEMSGTFQVIYNDNDFTYMITPLEGELFGTESINSQMLFIVGDVIGG